MRRERLLVILGLLIVAAVLVLRPGHRRRARVWSEVRVVRSFSDDRTFPIVVEDDPGSLFSTGAARAAFFRTLRFLGVRILRVSSDWSVQAPDGNARRPPPGFRASDPDAYPLARMANLDEAVRAAARSGITVDLDIGFYAPLWATGARQVADRDGANPYHDAIDPARFAAYAGMLARRYSGTFTPRGETRPLPRVGLYEIWNEPNLGWDYGPQRVAGRIVSPGLYRRLVAAGTAALTGVDPRVRVLVGNLSSTAGRSGVTPLRFLEAFACVDAGLRPVSTGDCRRFKPAQMAGFAHHPYEYLAPPWVHSARLTEAPIADLDRVQLLLDALVAAHRLPRAAENLWITEAGYQDNAVLRAMSPWNRRTQARFLAISEYEAWTDPQARSFAQFLVRDDRVRESLRAGRTLAGTWTTGLETERGARKPAFWMLRTPVVARVLPAAGDCHALEVWGRLTPARSAVAAAVQFAKGSFTTVARLRTGRDGVLDALVQYRGPIPGRVRIAFAARGTTVLSPGVSPVFLGAQPLPAGMPGSVSCAS